MKSGILTIMKKELARFFGDKRTVAGVLLPGVMIYVLYSFMGTAMGSVFGVEEDYVPSIQAVRLPQSIAALADSAGMALTEGEEAGLPAAMDQVAGQELDLLVVFPEDFDQAVADYSVASGEPAPHVEVYYSSVSTASQSAYMAFTGLLDSYESLLANKFDVNAGEGVYDLATACIPAARRWPRSPSPGRRSGAPSPRCWSRPSAAATLRWGRSWPWRSSPCSPARPAPWGPSCLCPISWAGRPGRWTRTSTACGITCFWRR